MPWRFAIDTGGTFTDVVAVDEATGDRRVLKLASTPGDPSRGLLEGVKGIAGERLEDVGTVIHGTTAATNAILEGAYATAGLIVTGGFRDILEVRRQDVPGEFGDITWWIKPDRIVPREIVREVGGRLDARGRELRALDEPRLREIAREYRSLGIDAIAVSFIHSYANPAHEQRARELIEREHPTAQVSLSSEVIREYREYERTLGTCLNTVLMPLMGSYIGALEHHLGAAPGEPRLFMMQSAGGIARAGELAARPIATVLSGPAAGVIAACDYGARAGEPRLLTLDVGGTSADIAMIEGRMPTVLGEGRVGEHEIRTPMIDMTTVGAGGGSIAWLSDSGSLRVGPRSAGAVPGPVCYGAGGSRPTVTDAQLVLGRIPDMLLDGELALDREAAAAAIACEIAEPLGLELEAAALGILRIGVAGMAHGIRLVSVRRGRDPRESALFAFGGGGGMHACLTAEALGMTRVLIPPAPGATSAEGLLLADVRAERSRTLVMREDALSLESFACARRELEAGACEELMRQGFAPDEIELSAYTELRYAGQAYEIRVPFELDRPLAPAFDRALMRFHDAHEDQIGFSYAGREVVELVTLGVAGARPLGAPVAAAPHDPEGGWADYVVGEREVVFDAGGRRRVQIVRRPTVDVEGLLEGPAVIEQYDTTTVIEPGWCVGVAAGGCLLLTREPNRAQ